MLAYLFTKKRLFIIIIIMVLQYKKNSTEIQRQVLPVAYN